jgi:cytochrome c-type biogenesis protein CcmH
MRLVALAALAAMLLVPSLVRADALDDSVRHVAMQLQCPVCEGENVADSPSGLAGDMRSVIRAKVIAGEPDQQILDEFVASYGDSILTDPPKRGISLGVWIGPVVAVALGATVVVLLLRSWRRPALTTSAKTRTLATDADVVSEFHRFREELGR